MGKPSERSILIIGAALAFLVSGSIVAYFQTRPPEEDPYATLTQFPRIFPPPHPRGVPPDTSAPNANGPHGTTPGEASAEAPVTASQTPGNPDFDSRFSQKTTPQPAKQTPNQSSAAGKVASTQSGTAVKPPSWFSPPGSGTGPSDQLGAEGNDNLIASRFDEPEFVYSKLPSDAPDAEFPLLLASEHDTDLTPIQNADLNGHTAPADSDMNSTLSPNEQDMITHARAGFLAVPPSKPTPPTPPVIIPTPPESPSGL